MLINSFIVIISFLVVLSVIVFIHELGHYGVAKLCKTQVERFSVGFGKPVAGWTSDEGEQWVIGRWPLGGYVKFAGDDSVASAHDPDALARAEAKGLDPSRLFQNKPVGQRMLIALAGPMANFILAIVIFAGLAFGLGRVTAAPVVTEVQAGGAAEAAGLAVNDRFLSIDGRTMATTDDVRSYIALRSDEPMLARVERNGATLELPITPRRVIRDDAIGGQAELGTIGILIGGRDNMIVERFGPLESVGVGVEQLWDSIAMTGVYVKRIFAGKEDGKQLGGVLRIAAVTGKVAVDGANLDVDLGDKLRATLLSLLTLAAFLSVGLGLANLLPIPMLDGGHLLFYSYEALAGRPMSVEAQNIGYRLGIAVLAGLFIILTFNDVGYIRSLLS